MPEKTYNHWIGWQSFLLSHSLFHQKNFNLIINILINNNYPLEFIFQTLHNRLKFLIHNSNTIVKTPDKENVDVSFKFFIVPYVPLISDGFKSLARDIGIRMSYVSLNKLHCFIKVQKDKLFRLSSRNVMYRIDCNNYDASYVRQMGRQLQIRINEHRNHIRRNTSNHSVITDHRLEFNHDFKWDDIKILDNEPLFKQTPDLRDVVYQKTEE